MENILQLPNEFKSACKRFQITPKTALEFYINNMTVYSNLSGDANDCESFASMLYGEYRKKHGLDKHIMNEENRLTGIYYLKVIMQLISTKEKKESKVVRYNTVIDDWYNAIRTTLAPKVIKLDNKSNIALTNDFCILCYILQCTPLKLLQFYANHVKIQVFYGPAVESTASYALSFFLHYPSILKQLKSG